MRIATGVLIILAGVSVGRAQQLERPFWPIPQTQQPAVPKPFTPRFAARRLVTPQRSGPVCLKSVPADPSLDRAFVSPVPDTRNLPMRIIEMPPCVTPAPQLPR